MQYDKENDRYILNSGNDELALYYDASNQSEGVEIDCRGDYIVIPDSLLAELIDGLNQILEKRRPLGYHDVEKYYPD